MGGLLHQARAEYHEFTDLEQPSPKPMQIIERVDWGKRKSENDKFSPRKRQASIQR
jgi:hypothetical protein